MTDVLVTFKEDVSSERRESILGDVARWQGVQVAAPLKRDGPPEFLRFAFVRVRNADAERVAGELRRLGEVEEAQVAPRRGL